MGTHYLDCNGRGLLTEVPIFAHGVAICRATILVGFVHQIPGKSPLVPLSGEAIDTNIIVFPVDKDDLPFGNPQ